MIGTISKVGLHQGTLAFGFFVCLFYFFSEPSVGQALPSCELRLPGFLQEELNLPMGVSQEAGAFQVSLELMVAPSRHIAANYK